MPKPMGDASAAHTAATRAVPSAGRELYVYYKVRGDSAAAALAAVRALQRELSAEHPALVVRLLRRPDEADGLQTWMETYAIGDGNGAAIKPKAEGIGSELQAHIERRAAVLAPHLASPRHVEVFVRLDRAD